jgi:ELWxxDGT repeat protein
VYFTAYTDATGAELWKSDGTAAGTVMVRDINPGADNSYPANMVNWNGILFFTASHNSAGASGLWKSDGTTSGTELVKELSADGSVAAPGQLLVAGSQLFIVASTAATGAELWKSDGTTDGTILVKDINPGMNNAINSSWRLMNTGNQIVFIADDGVHGEEMWRSDGSPAGTKLVQDVEPNGSAYYEDYLQVGSSLLASVGASGLGMELWVIADVNALPLTFLEFSGRLVKDDALLSWKTTNEVNTQQFIVERSTDARQFSSIGTIPSLNTPGNHLYSFTDRYITSLGLPVVYYRLKQMDIDGHSTFSKIIAIAVNSQIAVMLYPNPVVNQANLSVNLQRTEELNCKVIDNAGKIMYQSTARFSAGTTNLQVDVHSWPAGVYYFIISGNSINRQVRFVK